MVEPIQVKSIKPIAKELFIEINEDNQSNVKDLDIKEDIIESKDKKTSRVNISFFSNFGAVKDLAQSALQTPLL